MQPTGNPPIRENKNVLPPRPEVWKNFLKNLLVFIPKKFITPLCIEKPDTTRNGNNDGIIVLAHRASPCFTPSAEREGNLIRTNAKKIHAINKATVLKEALIFIFFIIITTVINI